MIRIKLIFSALSIFVLFCSTAQYSDLGAKEQSIFLADPNNQLSGKTETIEMEYIVWGCACANWIKLGGYEKHQDDRLIDQVVFIEPATGALELPSDFDPFKQFIRVKGQFYEKPDYPKGTIEAEEPLQKAKVFCYTEIEILQKEE